MELRDEASRKGLDELCRELITPAMTVVEIGCFGGESTCIFAQYAGRVYAVDPWSDNYRSSIRDGCSNDWILAYLDANPLPPMTEIEALFDQRVYRKRNVVKVRKASRDALAQFSSESIDLVYIDSIHTEAAVAEAIREWRPKLKPGGIIAGHDYDAEIWPEVVRVVDREFSRPHYVFGDTSWAVRLS